MWVASDAESLRGAWADGGKLERLDSSSFLRPKHSRPVPHRLEGILISGTQWPTDWGHDGWKFSPPRSLINRPEWYFGQRVLPSLYHLYSLQPESRGDQLLAQIDSSVNVKIYCTGTRRCPIPERLTWRTPPRTQRFISMQILVLNYFTHDGFYREAVLIKHGGRISLCAGSPGDSLSFWSGYIVCWKKRRSRWQP